MVGEGSEGHGAAGARAGATGGQMGFTVHGTGQGAWDYEGRIYGLVVEQGVGHTRAADLRLGLDWGFNLG